MHLLQILASICFSFMILPGHSQAASSPYFLCKNGNIIRSLRIQKLKVTGECLTLYTKGGKDKVVGEGQYYEFCESVLNNIRDNLDKAGWTCRDISKKSKIDFLEE